MEEIETIMSGFDDEQLVACSWLMRNLWARRLLKSKLFKFLTMYGGLCIVTLITFLLVYVNGFYSCPSLYDGDFEQCRYPLYFAYFINLEMILNIIMFHYTFKLNRVNSLVPMSILLRKGEDYRNSNSFLNDETENRLDANKSNVVSEKTKYCRTCQIIVPERCHHCPLCNCCVMRKDHHCYVTGGCVGFANQRYFVVFVFWSLIGGLYSVFYMIRYLNKFYIPFLPYGFLHYILPVPFVKWFIGSCTFSQLCYALLLNLGLWASSGAMTFFCAQWYFILKNITMYERLKKQYVPKDSSTYFERLRFVFGPMCILNFIFPMPFKNKKEKSLKQFLIEWEAYVV